MTGGANGVALAVSALFSLAVAVTGFLAARWRKAGDAHTLDEWRLGGRSFGTWTTWVTRPRRPFPALVGGLSTRWSHRWALSPAGRPA